MLDTYRMVVAVFSLTNKANWVRFFEETFLIANVSPEIVLGMSFFILNDVDIDFLERELWLRTYIAKKAFLITRYIELMDKKEFAPIALDPKHETYIIHIKSISSVALPSFSMLNIDVHPSCRPQISDLIAKKALIKFSAKYLDFADVFSLDLASKLLEYTKINNHAIKLVDGQQSTYESIYSLGPMELKTLKAYIKTNLVNDFIGPSKFPAIASILFDQKSDNFLRLYVNYRGLNNPTIKNRYLLLLIGELLNRLGRARQFTQFNFTSVYHWMRIRKGNNWKTAFRNWYGHFEYQVMFFGLTNASTSFQKYINKIFTEKFDIFIIMYLVDIFIYTDDHGDKYVIAIQ